MTILDHIIEWVEDKHPVIQKALFLILSKNFVGNDDIIELKDLLIDREYHRKEIEYIPLDTFKNLVKVLDGQETVNITSISKTSNINALIDDGSIEFEENGLNIIYGDNGSGKSSYVSLLKHVCKTRGDYPLITKNLYKVENINKDQFAEINFTKNAISSSVEWENAKISNFELKAVDVFDAKSANHYIENEDEIAFIPSDLSILVELASICSSIQNLLFDANQKLESKKFQYDFLIEELNTKENNLISDLSENSDINKIRSYKKLTTDQKARKESLEEELTRIKSKDPQKIIQINESKIFKLNLLSNKLQDIFDLISKEAFTSTISLSNLLKQKRNDVNKLKEQTFTNLEFKNIGNDDWKILWSSAKEFVTNHEENHPGIIDGFHCPLCIQELKKEAKQRFQSFEDYLSNQIEKEFSDTTDQLKLKYNSIQKISLDFPEFSDTIKELNKINKEFNSTYKSFITISKTALPKILKNIKKPDILLSIPLFEDKSPHQIIEEHIIKLKETNLALRNKNIESEVKKINDLILEIKEHEILSKYKPQLIKEILRLKKSSIFIKCIQHCNTKSITLLSNKITKEFVQNQLKSSFQKELKGLGFRNIEVNLQTKGTKGKQHNYLALSEEYGSSTKLKEILSEGEHRCISLATFFSELEIADHKSSIVFDDPVNSLDHRWRSKIAKRIVRESKDRQVILFTHDITFLMLLQEHGEVNSLPVHIKSLTRKRKATGIVEDNPPWDAMSINKRIAFLNTQFQNLKNTYDKETEIKYNQECKNFYNKLREAWERFVEEVFLNATIKRFGREIRTNQLKKIVDLTEDDYKRVERNMKKCSKYFEGHDTAASLIEAMPDVDEVKKDLEDLKTYKDQIRKRRK